MSIRGVTQYVELLLVVVTAIAALFLKAGRRFQGFRSRFVRRYFQAA